MLRPLPPLVILFAACLGLVIPGTASAESSDDFRYWTSDCGQGTLGCVSWGLRLQYDSSIGEGVWLNGGTRFTLTVINRQGAEGFDHVGSFGLSGIPFFLRNMAWAAPVHLGCIEAGRSEAECTSNEARGGAAFTSEGGAGLVFRDQPEEVVPLVNRGLSYNSFIWRRPGYGVEFGIEEWIYGTEAIRGCDPPEELILPQNRRWLTTCDGSLTMEGRLGGRLAFTEQTIELHGAVLVPEPSTYLLMLTGLIGLGFVSWRRREEMLAGEC